MLKLLIADDERIIRETIFKLLTGKNMIYEVIGFIVKTEFEAL